MANGRKGFHADPGTWVRDLHAKRVHTVDMHAHMITPRVEKLVADRPERKAELHARLQALGAQSVDHNHRILMPQVMPALTSLPVRLDDMDRIGVDIQVVSPMPTQCNYWADAELAEKIVSLQNEHIAEACSLHPDRLVGLGTLSLQHPHLAVTQLETAVRRLGLRGFQLSTQINARELSDPSLEPVWAKAQALGCVVFVHPMGCSFGERLSRAYLSTSVGQPLELAIAISHLIFAGVLDRYPALKICAAHGGGSLPSSIARCDHAFYARPDARTTREPPSAYLRRIWFDSLVYSSGALRQLIDQVGVSRIVIGTDYPFDMGHYDIHSMVGSTPSLEAAELDAILGGNAAPLAAGEPLIRVAQLACQFAHQIGRGQRAGERCALSGPVRSIAKFLFELRGSVQCLAGIVGSRVIGNLQWRYVASPMREAIWQTSGRTTRDHRGHLRVISSLALQRGSIAGIGKRFRAVDERSAKLCGSRTEFEDRGNAGTVHDAAGCNHWDTDVTYQQARECEYAEPVVGCGRIKAAAMATGFVALRNDRIESCICYEVCLAKIRGGRQQKNSRRFQLSQLR